MTLRAKDFCNCQHALMLLEAIGLALEEAGDRANFESVLRDALDEHKAAGDAWQDNEIWHSKNNGEGV